MFEFLSWFINLFNLIGNKLNQYTFPIGAVNVSILELFIGFIILGIVIAVFWKGAQSH